MLLIVHAAKVPFPIQESQGETQGIPAGLGQDLQVPEMAPLI